MGLTKPPPLSGDSGKTMVSGREKVSGKGVFPVLVFSGDSRQDSGPGRPKLAVLRKAENTLFSGTPFSYFLFLFWTTALDHPF